MWLSADGNRLLRFLQEHFLRWCSGTFSAIYTMSMAIAGQRFRGGQLANIMAAFGVMWGLGMTIGPATAGGAMDLWDPHGLPALLAVTCTVFVIFACWRQATKPAEQE